MIDVAVAVRDRVSPHELHELWRVYDEIFHDTADESEWLDSWDKHSSREGFRMALARIGDRLVGFAYGYTGHAGQWWTDQATLALGPVVAKDWLGGHFELVTIGVAPSARRTGAGRQLLNQLTTGLTQDRWLLMTTSDATDPARRLYASEGWTVIGPGLTAETVILGKLRPSKDNSPADRARA